MTSYIVRVYRRGGPDEEIVGTIAAPGREERTPFRSFRELKAILLRDENDEAPSSSGGERQKDDK
jgi:hypothetical protein